jgi:23S rRNA pseudouridine2604 synthase
VAQNQHPVLEARISYFPTSTMKPSLKKPSYKRTTKRVSKPTTKPGSQVQSEYPMRINKYLAIQGTASRREADVLIEQGIVLINGKKAVMGQKVERTDTVTLEGSTKEKKYLAYYKGRGIITHSPSAQEVDIATRLKNDYGITDVHPVGRLDKDSEGLLILTSDGRITGPLLSPERGHEKEYEVMVDKPVTGFLLQQLEHGVNIEGYKTKDAKALKHPKNKLMFSLTLTEGKKHQIRRMCAALGYQVQTLKRVRIANILLGELKPNQYRIIKDSELQSFLFELGVT